MIKRKAKQDTRKWINMMTHRVTVDCVEGGGRKRNPRRDLSWFLCPFLSVSLFFPAYQREHRSEGRRRFGHVEVVICCWRPPPTPSPDSFSFPTSCDLPALSLPPSPRRLRSLSISMRARPSRHNKATNVQECTFVASLFLLRWSKSAVCATERAFNSCTSYCSLLLMLHTK